MSRLSRRDPWDKQPGETPPAFDAFTAYRDLGSARSLAKVAARIGKSKGLVTRWSAGHSWCLRAEAWDHECDRDWQRTLLATRREAGRFNLELSQKAMETAAAALAAVDATKMRAGEIARLMESASKLQRLTLGEPTSNVRIGLPTTDATSYDAASMSDEERRARMNTLRREIDDRLAQDEPPDGAPSRTR